MNAKQTMTKSFSFLGVRTKQTNKKRKSASVNTTEISLKIWIVVWSDTVHTVVLLSYRQPGNGAKLKGLQTATLSFLRFIAAIIRHLGAVREHREEHFAQ